MDFRFGESTSIDAFLSKEAHPSRPLTRVGSRVSFSGGEGADVSYFSPPRKGQPGTVVASRKGHLLVVFDGGRFLPVLPRHVSVIPRRVASKRNAEVESLASSKWADDSLINRAKEDIWVVRESGGVTSIEAVYGGGVI